MPEDLAQRVRRSCRAAVERAQLVAIDDRALRDLAGELAGAPMSEQAPAGTPPDPEGQAALVLALDAVNFGSGWHDVVRKRPGLSGARTMAAALRDHAARSGPLRAEDLAAMTPARCAAIFDQDPDHPEQAELVALFATALADLGHLVAEEHGRSFLAVVEGAGGSAVSLAESLLAMAGYRDRAVLDGLDVHFYKRAQITAADLYRELGGWGPTRFRDLDRLTAFADNLVPHVLRVDGVLRYDPDLAASIDAGQRLQPGSRPEVEIRAAGVDAVERLVDELARRRRPVRAMDLDLVLWTRGADRRYKSVPRHRARTVFY